MIITIILMVTGLSYAKKPQQKTEILVSAASSLSEVLTELGVRFETQYPGLKVIYNFAATGVLQTQIEQGAPVDVFAGASLNNLTNLNNKGLLDQKSVKTLCHNTLALAIRANLNIPVDTGFSLVESTRIQRIAIGDPAYVPAGKYAVDLLTQLKLTDAVRSKLIFASSVREALSWVETGEADAALVYATDVKIAKKIRLAAQTHPQGPVIISYGIALTKQGVTKTGVRDFLNYITGATGWKMFEQYGFLP